MMEIWLLDSENDKRFRRRMSSCLSESYPVEVFRTGLELVNAFDMAYRLQSWESDSKARCLIADSLDLKLPAGVGADHLFRSMFTLVPTLVIASQVNRHKMAAWSELGVVAVFLKPATELEVLYTLQSIEKSMQGSGGLLLPGTTKKFWICTTSVLADYVYNEIKRDNVSTGPLTAAEMKIFTALARIPFHWLSSEEIVQLAWYSGRVTSNSLAVHLLRLRRKLAEISLQITFHPDFGYRLEEG